jgi:abhydrolase domain-containing protein 6
VEIDGLRLVFDQRLSGGGEPVVMLHGFSSEGEVWSRFAGGLGGHDLVIPDLPGHGRSEFVSGAGYGAPAQANRVLALLDRLEIQSAHLIGNSMGGFIAATVALIAPRRVSSLGLVCTEGIATPRPSPAALALEGGKNPFLLDDPAEFEAFFALTMARPPFIPAFVRRSIAREYVSRRDRLAEIFSDFHRRNYLDGRLSEIVAPTWVAWGCRDRIIDSSGAAVWSTKLPHASLALYWDLGHMPMLEAPRRTSGDYRSFLAASSAR